jgi:hypothetical protein
MELLRKTVLTLALAGVTVGAQSATTTLEVRGRVSEHVSLASDGQFVIAAWAASQAEGGGTDVYAAASRDGGQSFAEPVRVSDGGTRADVSGEQPPQVAIATQPGGVREAIVLWTSKGTAGTRLLSARSADGGRTFGRPALVAGSGAAGNRGWEAMTTDTRGRALAIWLDHRDTARQASAGASHHHSDGVSEPGQGASKDPPLREDGAVRAQQSQLYFGSLDDSSPARGIARGVCYCCRTAMTTGPDGSIYAAWRHVYTGNRRDIAFTMSRDGGRTFAPPVRVSEDEWRLDGCPENGPAMVVDAQRRVHVVWPTVVRERGSSTLKLFHAVTADGAAFTRRSALPTAGAAYHPRLATAPDGSLLVAWDEVVDGVRRIRLARGTLDRLGIATFRPVSLSVNVDGRYPAMTMTPGHAVLAWTSRSAGAARIVVVRVPMS